MGKQRLYSATQGFHHLRLTLYGFAKSGRVYVGLRRDAAHVEAGAADVDVLEDNDLQSVLRCIDGSLVTARAGTDDD